MYRPSKLLLIGALLSSIAAVGCDQIVRFRTPQAYVKPKQVAEVRGPVAVPVWVRDAKSGDMKKAYVQLWPGWLIGPPSPESEVK
jgi:hypothetical protein